MEWYSIVEGIIILGAIIVVGVIQNRTIKAQEKELKAVRTFMEIFDVQKVKDYVDLSTETMTKKAEKSETDLAKKADELDATLLQLKESFENVEISFENLDDVLELYSKSNENIVILCSKVIEHLDIEEEIFKLEEGKEKEEGIKRLHLNAKKGKTNFDGIKIKAQKVVDKLKEMHEKSPS